MPACASWAEKNPRGPFTRRCSRIVRRDLLHQPDDGATQFCIFDAGERPYQFQALGSAKKVADERRRRGTHRLLSRCPAD